MAWQTSAACYKPRRDNQSHDTSRHRSKRGYICTTGTTETIINHSINIFFPLMSHWNYFSTSFDKSLVCACSLELPPPLSDHIGVWVAYQTISISTLTTGFPLPPPPQHCWYLDVLSNSNKHNGPSHPHFSDLVAICAHGLLSAHPPDLDLPDIHSVHTGHCPHSMRFPPHTIGPPPGHGTLKINITSQIYKIYKSSYQNKQR